MAETFTDKLKLSKRDTGDLNWGQGANANLEALDQHVQPALLRPPRTLNATLGSGGVGANLSGNTSYFYKVTAVNAAGETTEGKVPATVESQVTQPATPLPVILQWETVKGATGYKVYKATTSGQEKFLASVSGESASTYTDDGNTAVNPSISVPASNSARTSVSRIIAGANVTISPPDGTGEVTVNAASSAPPDASDTVKGVAKLSVTPASPTNPIAVGDNDPRNTNSRAPTGTAGGDLSGNYPTPAVAKVNGVSVPASPSAGQVLTATSPSAAAWQAPAGGGGYATVVVAAPSGIPSTDTANISAAMSGLPASGGTVILREGTYQINSQMNLPTDKPVSIIGQGMKSTTLQAVSGMTGSSVIFMAGSYIRNITFRDFHVENASGIYAGFFKSNGSTVENVDFDFVRISGKSMTMATIMRGSVGNTITRRITFTECVALDDASLVVSSLGSSMEVHEDVKLVNCRVYTTTGSGVLVAGAFKKLIITGCQCVDTSTFANFIHTGGSGNPCESWVITGCTFVGGSKGIWIPNNTPLRNSTIANNVFQTGSNAILAEGELSNSVISGNRATTAIQLNANAASTGNLIEGNKATVTDNSGQSNTVVATHVTGVRKLGAANPLAGDVKLDQGSGVTLTQDDATNKITIAAAAAGNWKLVANLTQSGAGQIGPDFTGLSLATHKSYKLVFAGQVVSYTAPSYLVLRTNGAASNGAFHLTQQQGATQTDEAASGASVMKLVKMPGGSGTAYELSGEILIPPAPQSGSVHALCQFLLTNQSAVENPQRGYSAARIYLGADLTSLGLQGDVSNFQIQSGFQYQLYEAQ